MFYLVLVFVGGAVLVPQPYPTLQACREISTSNAMLAMDTTSGNGGANLSSFMCVTSKVIDGNRAAKTP